jgi:serine/threonine protein kinase
MPETTLPDFLSHLEDSNLLTDEQLAAVDGGTDGSPTELAKQLVADGLLPRWQAQMLLSGRDRFFLGKYKLLDHIGQGGMGAVLKAEQQPIGRVVAIKVMAEKLVEDVDALARFRREIQAAAALNHANIVAVFDADASHGMHFLVMELLEGEDLAAVAKRRGKLSIGEAAEYIRQAAEGLQHAHERGMVHRDIKPSNLLLTWSSKRPVVKVLDMGLARFTSESDGSSHRTQTGQIMGTPDYISPEQSRDTKHADIRSDIFSLGCSLFRLVAGRVPFEGGNAVKKIMARTLDEAPLLSSVLPDVPSEFETVVAKMLTRDPAERYQTPGEVVEALQSFATISDDLETLQLSASGERQPPCCFHRVCNVTRGLTPPAGHAA